MAGVLQHLRSSTLDKRPNPASMVDGQVAINYASGSPGMFFKDSNGSLVKVGPVHVGSTAPNVSPASGGTAGNSIGEQWLDNSGGTYVFKIWDGSAWRSEAGEFVNATGDTMTGDLVMDNANLVFEGSVEDGFETTLTVVNPTADRTITLPNVTGTVVTTGDSGTVTSTMIANSTIVNADVNASAAIAGTKISPDFGSQTIKTTGIISAAGGSAAAPSIAFTGDTNTGLYSPGADQVAISTNGTGRLFVDASGNVGVGTASPGALLNLSSSANAALRLTDTAGSYADFIYNESGTVSQLIIDADPGNASTPATDILFKTDGSERLRITSDGKLGLGTSSPEAVLHIAPGGVAPSSIGGRSINYGANLVATSGRSGYLVRVGNNFTTTDDNSGFMWLYPFDTGGAANYKVFRSATGSTLVDKFWVNQAGGGYFASNVGIGTTSPDANLEISTTSASETELQRLRVEGNTNNPMLRFFASESNKLLTIGTSGSLGGHELSFRIGNNEAGRFDTAGRLLVGTSTTPPAIETLTPGLVRSGSGTTQDDYSVGIYCYRNAGGSGRQTIAPRLYFARSRSGTNGSTGGVVVNNEDIGNIRFAGDDGTNFITAAEILAEVDGTPGTDDMPGRLVFSTTADGSSSPTERMRITSGGEVWINTTTGSTNETTFGTVMSRNGNIGLFYTSRNVSGAGTVAGFWGNAGSLFVRGDGDCENTNNSYSGISDIKLKENIIDANSQWDDLKALQVRNYNFKAETGYNTHTQIGLIAQEVELVSPGLVGESIDEETGESTKSVNYSVLYMKAVKALQEAMERIEVLEQRLTDAGIA